MARKSHSDPAERSPVDPEQVRQSFVDGKRISLAVRGNATRGFRLERRSASPGEPVSTQYLDLQDSTAVAAFIEHDPYAPQLTNDYRAVLPLEAPQQQHPALGPQPEFATVRELR